MPLESPATRRRTRMGRLLVSGRRRGDLARAGVPLPAANCRRRRSRLGQARRASRSGNLGGDAAARPGRRRPPCSTRLLRLRRLSVVPVRRSRRHSRGNRLHSTRSTGPARRELHRAHLYRGRKGDQGIFDFTIAGEDGTTILQLEGYRNIIVSETPASDCSSRRHEVMIDRATSRSIVAACRTHRGHQRRAHATRTAARQLAARARATRTAAPAECPSSRSLAVRPLGREATRSTSASPQSCELASIAISSRNERGESVRPTVAFMARRGLGRSPFRTANGSSPAVSKRVRTSRSASTYGPPDARLPSFLATWFTPSEQAWANEAGADVACLVWAAKEAVYKAVNDGEKFAPRKIEIPFDENDGDQGLLRWPRAVLRNLKAAQSTTT